MSFALDRLLESKSKKEVISQIGCFELRHFICMRNRVLCRFTASETATNWQALELVERHNSLRTLACRHVKT